MTNVKRHQCSAILVCLVGCLTLLPVAQAAGKPRRAPTLVAARQLAEKAPGDILLLVTGSDWNPGSVRFKKEIINSPAFAAEFGEDLILVEIDMPENDPDGKKAALYRDANDLRRYVYRTPLLGLYDAQGRDCGQLDQGLEKMSAAEVATAIKRLITVRRQRDQLWTQANRLKGIQRAELLGQGLTLIQFGWGINESYHPHADDYQPVLDELRNADPGDSTGWLGRFTFDPYKLLAASKERTDAKQYEAALAEIEKVLSNKRLTPEYRQRSLAVKYSVYQAWTGHETEKLDVLREIEKIDPNSLLGLGAQRWARYQTGPADLEFGWRKQNVQTKYTTWEIPISHKLGQPGFYRLRLEYAWGVPAQQISIRALMIDIDGKTVWSRNEVVHPKFEEIIELPALGKGTAILKLEVKGDRGTNSHGRITLEPYYLRL